MTYQKAGFQVDKSALDRIWAAQGLGSIQTVDWAGKGVNNPALMINNRYVVRFDGLINEGVSRFYGEQIAYNHLKNAGIPCPEVLTFDDTKTLVPYDYMVMTRLPGTPLLDAWPTLTPFQQQQVAQEAGYLLAQMHNITLPQFGRLYGTEQVFNSWYAYIMARFEQDSQAGLADQVLSQAIYERMRAVFESYRPLFDGIGQPQLVHWDYHFGNLLQQDGKITAILDFEWALGGDPAHDFNRRSQWDEECPGSLAWVYTGWTGLHPLEADHEIRVSLYEMLWYIDCVVDAATSAEADLMHAKLLDRLTWLEDNR